MNRELFFTVRDHGYDVTTDGFGVTGVKVTPRAGAVVEVRITRRNLAERLGRLTGEGLYRDSVLLGHPVPLPDPLDPGKVGGQDSVQAAVYQDKIYWFWGDTLRMDYPLGLFRMARATTPLKETWRRPSGHPIPFEENGTKWLLFGSPNPNVRVPATLPDILNPDKYEAFTCLQAKDASQPPQPMTGRDGAAIWRWQKVLPPLDSKNERDLVSAGAIKPEHARYCPADAARPEDRVVLHRGSVRWNDHRKCWVLVAGQIGGTSSLLGEVWYAEADHPTGPFRQAVHVITHDRQTFYNVCHHDFLDRDGGRLIHFEGTYTNDFSGNPVRTPRYNYNQILYRLDLDSPGLRVGQMVRSKDT